MTNLLSSLLFGSCFFVCPQGLPIEQPPTCCLDDPIDPAFPFASYLLTLFSFAGIPATKSGGYEGYAFTKRSSGPDRTP